MSNALFEKLKLGSKNTKTICWPGNEEHVQMRVANENDYLQASIETDKLFPNITLGNGSRYEAEKQTQILFRCVTNTDSQPIGTITKFRELLTPEVKSALIDELDILHEECSPIIDTMDDREFDKLYNDIKKNVAEIGNVSNIHTLRRLVKFLISRL
ncbi:MAG TPA: hypothetical protein VMX17_16010 [Candidatus Glassbacteria bacterium]|nr:hypothetical protein [Candidatus Glassbacteria bacterium]